MKIMVYEFLYKGIIWSKANPYIRRARLYLYVRPWSLMSLILSPKKLKLHLCHKIVMISTTFMHVSFLHMILKLFLSTRGSNNAWINLICWGDYKERGDVLVRVILFVATFNINNRVNQSSHHIMHLMSYVHGSNNRFENEDSWCRNPHCFKLTLKPGY